MLQNILESFMKIQNIGEEPEEQGLVLLEKSVA
jgi:hypothetical protein